MYYSEYDFEETFKQILKERNLTVAAFCRETGYPESTFRNYLGKKKTQPTLPILVDLADYFGITIDKLIGRKVRKF